MTSSGLRVYFILAVKCNQIRIGCSVNIGRRLYEHQTSCPDTLQFLGSVAASDYSEKYLHRTFGKFRHHGEWFEADQSIFDFIVAHCVKEAIQATYERANRRLVRQRLRLQKENEIAKLEQEFIDKFRARDKAYQECLSLEQQAERGYTCSMPPVILTEHERIQSSERAKERWQTVIQTEEELAVMKAQLGQLGSKPTCSLQALYRRFLRKQLAAEQDAAQAA